jgi:hypothetical protein
VGRYDKQFPEVVEGVEMRAAVVVLFMLAGVVRADWFDTTTINGETVMGGQSAVWMTLSTDEYGRRVYKSAGGWWYVDELYWISIPPPGKAPGIYYCDVPSAFAHYSAGGSPDVMPSWYVPPVPPDPSGWRAALGNLSGYAGPMAASGILLFALIFGSVLVFRSIKRAAS